MGDEADILFMEKPSIDGKCDFCREAKLNVGCKTVYGSIIIYKIGASFQSSWFATVSPKTGGDPQKDFTIQLMPSMHLTHFSQVSFHPGLAENYGTAFSMLCMAASRLMAENNDLKADANTREEGISVATYGKCTTWKEKKEHLHVKIFPFKGAVGQPYTVDSTFEKLKIFKDGTREEYVRMRPVRKKQIDKERLDYIANRLISMLKSQ